MLLATAVTCALVGGTLATAQAQPGGPSTGAAALVSGTVERLNIDDFTNPLPADADEITLVRTADGAVQVPSSELADVANGATVRVGLRSTAGTRVTASGGLTSSMTGDAAHDPEAGTPVSSVEVVSTPAAGLSATGTGFTATNATIASGTANHRVTVVVVIPAGGSASTVTSAQVAATVSGGVNAYWQTVTGGAVGFTATAYPTVVSTSSAPCSGGSVSSSSTFWSEVASKVGWTAGSGKHLLVYFARYAGCSGIAGLGTVGNGVGSGGVTWTNGYNAVGVIGHELGHNLGLGHSQELDCAVSGVRVMDAAPSNCSARSYWDTNDIMAVSWNYQGYLNASHLRFLGLLDGTGETQATSSGQVTLSPLETGSGMRVLTLAKGADRYVVEFRQAIGLDAWMATTTGWGAPGVTVRREFDRTQPGASSFADNQSFVLDGDPASSDASFGNIRTTVPVGAWIDLAGGELAIRIVSQSSGGAVLDYRVGPSSSDPRYVAVPTPSLSVPNGHLAAGTTSVSQSGPVVPMRWSWNVTTPSINAAAAASISSAGALTRARSTIVGWNPAAYLAVARAVDGSLVTARGVVLTHYSTETRTTLASYSRNWSTVSRSGTVGGHVKQTSRRGASVTLRVAGSNVGVLLARGTAYGSVAVYLDGHRVATLQLHGMRSSLQLAWTAHFAGYGKHVVKLVNLTGGSHGSLGFDGVISQA